MAKRNLVKCFWNRICHKLNTTSGLENTRRCQTENRTLSTKESHDLPFPFTAALHLSLSLPPLLPFHRLLSDVVSGQGQSCVCRGRGRGRSQRSAGPPVSSSSSSSSRWDSRTTLAAETPSAPPAASGHLPTRLISKPREDGRSPTAAPRGNTSPPHHHHRVPAEAEASVS